MPELHIVSALSPFDALHNLALNIARASKARLDKPPRLHWDSWYEYYGDYDYRKLDEFLKGLKEIKPQLPFQSVLIDAGWSPLGDPSGMATKNCFMLSGNIMNSRLGQFWLSMPVLNPLKKP
jgi:hypothetical protein